MRIKNTGFGSAAALPTSENFQGMFVRGDKVAATLGTALRYDGLIGGFDSGKLNAIPEPFKSACDGMLMLPTVGGCWQTVFFKGDQACWYHWDNKLVSNGPWTALAKGGPTWNTLLPAAYKSDVDALLMDSIEESAVWRTYVFKGDRVATIDWATGCTRDVRIYEGAQPTAGWARLPAEWLRDYDHVLPLPSVSGAKRSLLIKGGNGCVFNWNTGPEKTGALTTLMPELAKLPAPYTTQYKPIVGRWATSAAPNPVTVRVDLDGLGATRQFSGDIDQISGATRSPLYSFRVSAPVIAASATEVTATGRVQWKPAWTGCTAKITIPRVTQTSSAPALRVEFRFDDGNVPTYDLPYESAHLRTIDLEIDAMANRAALASYNTATDAVAGPPDYVDRELTIASAFAEAGIELRAAGTVNEVGTADSGGDLKWSDSELHTAMLHNFSGRAESEQWKLWAFVASQHVNGHTGIMFDVNEGKQRQGMAVFYDQVNGNPGYFILGLYVHELGHCLNLLHSWEKNLAGAPLGTRDGYGDLSWMQYWNLYRAEDGSSGWDVFWSRFPFTFTANELAHLRHAFRYDIIPGGANWAAQGSAAYNTQDPALAAMDDPITDDSGLALTLSARPFAYGEPVTVEIKLARDGRDVTVHRDLSPKSEHLTVAVTAPSGITRPFRPLARQCNGHSDDTLTTLTAEAPALYESAYLGSGADGQYFTDPGLYTVRALYTAPDGSRVVSPNLTIRIRLPRTGDDQDAGELLMDDQTGTLMALLGSDSPALQTGNATLSELADRFPDHPLTVYANLAHGANAGRHYQHIQDGRLHVRQPDTKQAVTQLTAAIDASTGPGGLNNITLNAAMRRLATIHAKAGDTTAADATLTRMVDHFRNQHVPAAVLTTIQAQADTTRETIIPDHDTNPRNRNRRTKN
ncbi:tol-pal system YbgF family protein [Actinomadura sp. GTD37]|uniref:tetratricopeptide repeat protein n=1 Tax=Actinomadura sp. GTD37 TaxID=1778030 RepID=UPI0035C0EA63